MLNNVHGKSEFSDSESTTEKSFLQHMTQSSLLRRRALIILFPALIFLPPLPAEDRTQIQQSIPRWSFASERLITSGDV